MRSYINKTSGKSSFTYTFLYLEYMKFLLLYFSPTLYHVFHFKISPGCLNIIYIMLTL